jgi:hypothetical protein
MLATLEEKVENVHANLVTINEKMKDTLEKVRDSSKICVVTYPLFILKFYFCLIMLLF